MDDSVWRAVILCAANVESIAWLSVEFTTVVVGNMHGIATKGVVVNATSHFRREE
jgi:hypothetical protein